VPLLVALGDRIGAVREPPLRNPVALRPASVRRAFFLGLATGIVYFSGTLYWITHVMVTYGGLATPVAILVNALLVAYLSLFPALFAAFLVWSGRHLGSSAMMAAPFVWVASELGRTHLFGGFPWVLYGYSQVDMLPVAQTASILGVYGISALLVFANVALATVATRRGRGRWMPVAGAVAVIAVAGGWGTARLRGSSLTSAGTPLSVGLVQGNIAQEDKDSTDIVMRRRIFDVYLKMTAQAADRGARLVIWPESAAPFYFEDDRAAADELRALARRRSVAVLLGSDELEPENPPRYYNAAFLIGPDGTTAATVYRKVRLVPFGEYVPLRTLLFFAKPLVEAVSDFSAGQEPVTLPLGSHTISTAICYEVVYPALIRAFVTRGSQLLTTITNDAWFGRSSAPYQHFAQAAMRAIEQGRYLVRAANTGVTGIVDPYGRVLAESDIFVPVVLTGEVRLLSQRTVYGRIGYWFEYFSLAATAFAALAAFRMRNAGL
jgi:apolipoprotein N-acyltransferase